MPGAPHPEASGRRPAATSTGARITPLATALPRGFRFAAVSCGLKKKGGLDLALITSDRPAAAAAVFTTNRVQAAPVQLSREHLRRSRGRMCAIVVNSGNANCCTGTKGLAGARATAQGVARELGCRGEEVLVCSTGVIGVPLRVERILGALPELARARANRATAFASVTRAIMTTDTRPKWAAASCRLGGRRVRLLGCAKGAGMIAPNMATMLAFVLTDARLGGLAAPLLRDALREAVARTFNCITVDGDTSTNDTVVVLANGASAGGEMKRGAALRLRSLRLRSGQAGSAPTSPNVGRADYKRFSGALEKVCRALALAIVGDGEGSQRVIEIEVRGAPSSRAAGQVARTIAQSPLVKTALAGADPNWGRILAAAGRAGVAFNPARAKIWLAGIKVFSRGQPVAFDERVAHRRLLSNYVKIDVDLGEAKDRAPGTGHGSRIWTCDFTADYVRINADYRT